jgi:hypothetical protein
VHGSALGSDGEHTPINTDCRSPEMLLHGDLATGTVNQAAMTDRDEDQPDGQMTIKVGEKSLSTTKNKVNLRKSLQREYSLQIEKGTRFNEKRVSGSYALKEPKSAVISQMKTETRVTDPSRLEER